MKKKSLRPQIVAPVQRETTATSTSTGVGLVAVHHRNILRLLQALFQILSLLREMTRSNPPNSSTHLKKSQNSFSTSFGALLASRN